MANILFSAAAADASLVANFDPAADTLVFDTSSAAGTKVIPQGSSTTFQVGSASVTLPIALAALAASNTSFNDGSVLVIGDNASGTTGDEAANTIDLSTGTTQANANQVFGLGGNDVISMGSGASVVYGNTGDDEITGGAGAEVLYGGQGNDAVTGGGGANVLYGNLGGDTLTGGAVNDVLYGGQGDDTLAASGGSDVMYGNVGNDSITGGAGNDVLYGGQNADTVTGAAGDDAVYGNVGDDVLNGDAGNDALFGGQGADTISGGDGNDSLGGNKDNDVLTGGAGNDAFNFFGGGADVVTDFNLSQDTADLSTGSFTDYASVLAAITESGGNSVLDLGNGNSITFNGLTKAQFEAAGDVWVSSALTPTAGQTFTLTTGVDTLTGTNGNDTFIAVQSATGTTETFSVADRLDGGAGNDTLNLVSEEGAAVNAATVTNIENLIYRPTAAGGNISLDNFTSVTNLTVDRLVGATNIAGVALTDTLTLKDFLATADTTVTFGGTLTGASDSATVTIQGAADGGDVEFSGAVENMTINTSGSESKLADLVFDGATKSLTFNADEALTVGTTFTAAAVTKITATGDSKVTLTPALADTVVNVDASAQTGDDSGVTVTTGNVADTNGDGIDFTFLGGAGKDSVNVTGLDDADELSVTMGAGDDTVTLNGDVLDGTNDKVNGGDGNDTLVINDQAALTTQTVKSISNIENLSLTDDNDGALDTFDASLISGLTSLTVGASSAADGFTVNKISSTVADAVTVTGTQAVDLTLNVTDASKVGQIDTLNVTVDDGQTAVNTITLADLSADGVENVNITANDNVTFTATTGLTSFTKVDIGGAGVVNLTTGAVALGTNSTIDASDVTGNVTINATAATANGVAIIGSGTATNDLTGATALNDAITGGTGIDTVHTTTGTDSVDLVSDSSVDVVELEAATGTTTITNFDANSEDIIDVEIAAINGDEIEVTAAAAQAAAVTDRYYIVEQTVGTAASLTTGGTETIADFTDVADVAAFLGERFTNNSINFGVVLNDGTNSYIYNITDAGGDDPLTGEVVLIGVVNGAVLDDADLIFS